MPSSGRAAGDGEAAARSPCTLKAVPTGVTHRLVVECVRKSLVRDGANILGLGQEGGAVPELMRCLALLRSALPTEFPPPGR